MNRAFVAEVARYGVATAASAAVSLGLPLALHAAGLDGRVAAACGSVAAVAFSFAITRFFVFRRGGGLKRDVPRYLATLVAFRALEYGGFLLLYGPGGIAYAAALAIPLVVSSLTKFVVYRYLVFAPR